MFCLSGMLANLVVFGAVVAQGHTKANYYPNTWPNPRRLEVRSELPDQPEAEPSAGGGAALERCPRGGVQPELPRRREPALQPVSNATGRTTGSSSGTG